MSSSQNNHSSKFIPILTEIIDAPDQSNLDLPLESEPQEPQTEAKQGSVNFFAGYSSAPLEAEATGAESVEPLFFAQSKEVEKIEPALEPTSSPNVHTYTQQRTEAQMGQEPVKLNTDWQDRPSMAKVDSLRSREEGDLEGGNASFHYDELEQEETFSPLSRNPMAQDDQLRPSDLMLVALTERIASKVRMRVGKDLDAHIQSKIFPLLDGFADQLVKHLEIDLLKLIREGIAEATREELERLSQRNKK